MASALGYIRRSLIGPLVFLAMGFIAVPIALYFTFQQADSDRQALLIRTIHAQGRIVADAVAPLLGGGVRQLTTTPSRVRIGGRVALVCAPRLLAGVVGSSSSPRRRASTPARWIRNAGISSGKACSMI
jgi:hypothetical protein